MGRKFFVGGNWKMNGTKAGIDSIIDFLSKGPLDPNAGVPVFYFIYLFTYTVEKNVNFSENVHILYSLIDY